MTIVYNMRYNCKRNVVIPKFNHKLNQKRLNSILNYLKTITKQKISIFNFNYCPDKFELHLQINNINHNYLINKMNEFLEFHKTLFPQHWKHVVHTIKESSFIVNTIGYNSTTSRKSSRKSTRTVTPIEPDPNYDSLNDFSNLIINSGY